MNLPQKIIGMFLENRRQYGILQYTMPIYEVNFRIDDFRQIVTGLKMFRIYDVFHS